MCSIYGVSASEPEYKQLCMCVRACVAYYCVRVCTRSCVPPLSAVRGGAIWFRWESGGKRESMRRGHSHIRTQYTKVARRSTHIHTHTHAISINTCAQSAKRTVHFIFCSLSRCHFLAFHRFPRFSNRTNILNSKTKRKIYLCTTAANLINVR